MSDHRERTVLALLNNVTNVLDSVEDLVDVEFKCDILLQSIGMLNTIEDYLDCNYGENEL